MHASLQGTRVNVNSINVAKACAQVGNIIPAGGSNNDEFLLSIQPDDARGGSQMGSARGGDRGGPGYPQENRNTRTEWEDV